MEVPAERWCAGVVDRKVEEAAGVCDELLKLPDWFDGAPLVEADMVVAVPVLADGAGAVDADCEKPTRELPGGDPNVSKDSTARGDVVTRFGRFADDDADDEEKPPAPSTGVVAPEVMLLERTADPDTLALEGVGELPLVALADELVVPLGVVAEPSSGAIRQSIHEIIFDFSFAFCFSSTV